MYLIYDSIFEKGPIQTDVESLELSKLRNNIPPLETDPVVPVTPESFFTSSVSFGLNPREQIFGKGASKAELGYTQVA